MVGLIKKAQYNKEWLWAERQEVKKPVIVLETLEWMKGGGDLKAKTLHEWMTSDYAMQLATCSQTLLTYDMDARPKALELGTFEAIKPDAENCVRCVNRKSEDEDAKTDAVTTTITWCMNTEWGKEVLSGVSPEERRADAARHSAESRAKSFEHGMSQREAYRIMERSPLYTCSNEEGFTVWLWDHSPECNMVMMLVKQGEVVGWDAGMLCGNSGRELRAMTLEQVSKRTCEF